MIDFKNFARRSAYAEPAGSALLPSGFVVKSTCVVRTASDGRIASIEERWNGAPLLDYSAFRWVRRANGLVSAILTPIFT